MRTIKAPLAMLIILVLNCVFYFTGYQQTVGFSDILQNPAYLFGAMFSHADLNHLLGNMLFLVLAGFSVEEYLGFLPFTALYLFCGLVSALGFLLMYPSAQLIGASGAICGIVAVYPFCQKTITQLVATGLAITFYFYEQFQMAFLQAQGLLLIPVAALAHVAGAVAGILLFTLYASKFNFDNK